MARFAIRPRRYADQLDAVVAKLDDYRSKGFVIDPKRNPNGKYELLLWCSEEIKRLRESNAILKAIVDLDKEQIHEDRSND
jgi:hypothetical protein